MKVILDPGHGGEDRGAEYFGVTEAKINLEVAKLLNEYLNSDQRFQAYLTRYKDINLTLEERSEFANTKNGDLFISLHANAFNQSLAKGVEFYFQNQLPPDEEVLYLANKENENKNGFVTSDWPLEPIADHDHLKPEVMSIIQDLQLNSRIRFSSQLAEFLNMHWKGITRPKKHAIKQAPFHVISHVMMPANLIEMGYLSNKKEAHNLNSPKYQKKIAKSIFEGLIKYKETIDKSPVNDLN
ncbi:MAG: N-acetylmuramoyl-L-alanine amidase [Bdellovibrionales bacterium]|nr:N-acetylmuramoyl-L-alanine amidase [Bdellovibrionales bacterium]